MMPCNALYTGYVLLPLLLSRELEALRRGDSQPKAETLKPNSIQLWIYPCSQALCHAGHELLACTLPAGHHKLFFSGHNRDESFVQSPQAGSLDLFGGTKLPLDRKLEAIPTDWLQRITKCHQKATGKSAV